MRTVHAYMEHVVHTSKWLDRTNNYRESTTTGDKSTGLPIGSFKGTLDCLFYCIIK